MHFVNRQFGASSVEAWSLITAVQSTDGVVKTESANFPTPWTEPERGVELRLPCCRRVDLAGQGPPTPSLRPPSDWIS